MTPLRIAPLRRILGWNILISLSSWVVLGGLAITGRLPLWEAILAGGVVFALTVAGSFALLSDFEKLIRHAEHLVKDPTAPAPRLNRSEGARRLATAIETLQKSWEERRDAAEALARSRTAILNSLSDPLLLINRSREVVGANRAAEDVFGKEMRNRDLATIIRDPLMLSAADRALTDGNASETAFSITAPVERSFSCITGVLANAATDGAVVIMQLHDITESLKTERMRGDFVANASHELRTPLASVLGFIETLQGPAKDDPDARQQFLEIMFKQASLMARLIDDLLSLSRIELKEHTRPTEKVSVPLLIQTTCEMLTGQAKEQSVTFDIIAADGLPEVLGDRDELGQIFQNLILNAVKYGGEAGRVEIEIKVQDKAPGLSGGPWLATSVRDFGDGIAAEHIPRLTERFYRVDTARSREMGGTGLGLAIVKHITKRHRGHLQINSVVGEGSTFSVYLPVAGAKSTTLNALESAA